MGKTKSYYRIKRGGIKIKHILSNILSQSPNDTERLHKRTEKSIAKAIT